jgi:8-oxo-dGTP pyrophosphatase MutT (NUDIX family)
VVRIEQYRYGSGTVTLEVPGGIMNPGEEPIDSARREMMEETGYDSPRILPIGMNEPNPAFLRNRCFSFLALDASATAETRFDEHENIRVRLVPLAEVPGMIRDGVITHSLVIVAFHALSLRTGLLPSHIVYQ